MNKNVLSFVKTFREKVIPFLVRRRFEVLLAAVLLYFLWPNFAAPFRGNNGISQSQSADGQSVQNLQADGVPLYDPNSQNSDPKWGLPAELKSAEFQSFASTIDRLVTEDKRYQSFISLRKQYLIGLLSLDVKNRLWPALHGTGFKDQRLPLDWFALVKDDYNKDRDLAELEDDQQQDIWRAVATRLDSIQTRLLGGQVLTGDVLFGKALQRYFDQHLVPLTKTVHQMANIFIRMRREFPDPQTAKDDLTADSFKTLVIGMSLEDVQSKFTVVYDGKGPVTKVEFDDSDYLLSVGAYPLKGLSAFFFNGRLYRICLTFDKNQQDMLQIFHECYIAYSDDGHGHWKRKDEFLAAQLVTNQIGGEVVPCAVILGHDDGTWDEIDIFDYSAWKQAANFYSPPEDSVRTD